MGRPVYWTCLESAFDAVDEEAYVDVVGLRLQHDHPARRSPRHHQIQLALGHLQGILSLYMFRMVHQVVLFVGGLILVLH